ncbi:MAG: RnfH family protein [Gammaproteobacteria bacterium]|nr:MAG: RnfH family protein [Gammaproteobacteria bacterium]
MNVEVVFASEHDQAIVPVSLAKGSTLEDAIRHSGILRQFPEIDLKKCAVGIFSKRAALTDVVREGDRIEIYRRLRIDPKEARRHRARLKSS